MSVNLTGDDHVADLVGLRYDVGVEGVETLIDYRIEVRDFSGQRSIFDKGDETSDVVFCGSKAGRIVGFELHDEGAETRTDFLEVEGLRVGSAGKKDVFS